MPNFITSFFNVKKISYFLIIVIGLSLGGLNAWPDVLKVNGKILCSNTGAVSVKDNVYSIACRDREKPAPTPDRIPAPSQPPPKPLPVVASKCGLPERDVRIERFTGKGIEKEFTLVNGSKLVVPFPSGSLGNVNKIALGEPSVGEHFKKTVIISKCPGVYNPEDYDYRTSTDVCVVTGLELSFSVITGQSRADHKISSYRCVLEPNEQYYLHVFQYDAGNRPPFVADRTNTCRTNRCGVRVSIR